MYIYRTHHRPSIKYPFNKRDYKHTKTHTHWQKSAVCLISAQPQCFFQEFNMAAALLPTSLLHSTDRLDGPALDDILMSVCGREALTGVTIESCTHAQMHGCTQRLIHTKTQRATVHMYTDTHSHQSLLKLNANSGTEERALSSATLIIAYIPII